MDTNIFHKPTHFVRAVLAMSIAILLFVLSLSKKIDFVRIPLDSLTNKLFIFNSGTDQIANHLNTSFLDVQALNDEHEDLRKKILELEHQLSSYKAIVNENLQLKSLLNIDNNLIAKTQVVRVVNTEQGIKNNIIFINEGEYKNIFIGQNIYDSRGLVGQVFSTSGYSSRVLLITDVNSFVPVYNINNNEEYVIKGTNTLELDVEYLRSKSKVNVGDLLYTNDLGGRFIPNYPVARVTKVVRDLDQSVIAVKAEPIANLNSFKFIVAVWPFCNQETFSNSNEDSNSTDTNLKKFNQTDSKSMSDEDRDFNTLINQDYRTLNCYMRNGSTMRYIDSVESRGVDGE